MKSQKHRPTNNQQSTSFPGDLNLSQSRNNVEDIFVFTSHTTHDKDDTNTATSTKEIRLMMLSCEDSAPYGPSKETAVSEIILGAVKSACPAVKAAKIFENPSCCKFFKRTN